MREKIGELLKPMARVARMIERRSEGILAQWNRVRLLTTAFTEGLNSLFSAFKRKARGYKKVEYMTTIQEFGAGEIALPCYSPIESSEKPNRKINAQKNQKIVNRFSISLPCVGTGKQGARSKRIGHHTRIKKLWNP